MSYQLRREKLEHGHERIVIHSGSRDAWAVGFPGDWSGTCIQSLDSRRESYAKPGETGHIYHDELEAIYEALTILRAERRAKREADEKAWPARADRFKDEYPDRLTYNRSDGIAILSVAQLRRRESSPGAGTLDRWAEIFHQGEWWTLCRADLMGEVSSGIDIRIDFNADMEKVRQEYLKRIRCGVRLKRREGRHSSFQCIDSLTDG
jgi:hypothetical protein